MADSILTRARPLLVGAARRRRARARRPDGARAGAPARVVRHVQAGVARVADARAHPADGAHAEPLLLRAARAGERGPLRRRRRYGPTSLSALARRRPRPGGARLPRARSSRTPSSTSSSDGSPPSPASHRGLAARHRLERVRADRRGGARAARHRVPRSAALVAGALATGTVRRRARGDDASPPRRARWSGSRCSPAPTASPGQRGAAPPADRVRPPLRHRLPRHRPAAAVPPVRGFRRRSPPRRSPSTASARSSCRWWTSCTRRYRSCSRSASPSRTARAAHAAPGCGCSTRRCFSSRSRSCPLAGLLLVVAPALIELRLLAGLPRSGPHLPALGAVPSSSPRCRSTA